jgi:hypothetical protein
VEGRVTARDWRDVLLAPRYSCPNYGTMVDDHHRCEWPGNDDRGPLSEYPTCPSCGGKVVERLPPSERQAVPVLVVADEPAVTRAPAADVTAECDAISGAAYQLVATAVGALAERLEGGSATTDDEPSERDPERYYDAERCSELREHHGGRP